LLAIAFITTDVALCFFPVSGMRVDRLQNVTRSS